MPTADWNGFSSSVRRSRPGADSSSNWRKPTPLETGTDALLAAKRARRHPDGIRPIEAPSGGSCTAHYGLVPAPYVALTTHGTTGSKPTVKPASGTPPGAPQGHFLPADHVLQGLADRAAIRMRRG